MPGGVFVDLQIGFENVFSNKSQVQYENDISFIHGSDRREVIGHFVRPRRAACVMPPTGGL